MKKISEVLEQLGLSSETEVTSEVVAAIVGAAFPDGLPLRKGWRMKLGFVPGEDGVTFRAYNPSMADKGVAETFFAVENSSHAYGAPMIVEEPSLGISCAALDLPSTGNIVGAIVEDQDGNVVIEDGKPLRFSWSNLAKQGKQFAFENGEFLIDGKSYGFVQVLYHANKNRIIGFIAGIGPVRPDVIRFKEVEDVKLTKV